MPYLQMTMLKDFLAALSGQLFLTSAPLLEDKEAWSMHGGTRI